MRRIAKPFAALIALLFLPTLAPAAPLADKIPGDAIIYAGWQGTDQLGAAYTNSNLKGVVDAMNLQDLMGQFWAKGLKDAEAQGKADDAKLFGELLNTALKSPTAMYVQGLDMTDPQKPVPNIAFICQMGKGAEDLVKRLAVFQEKNRKETDPPTVWKAVGDYLVLSIGSPTDLTPYLTGVVDHYPKPPLSADPAFLAASKQAGDSPALCIYASGEALRKLAGEAAAARPQQQGPSFENIMAATGLAGVKHAIMTGGFDGKNWSTQAFVELDKDRSGLVSFIDNAPLSPDALKTIPKSASWATVARFDGKRCLADIRAGALLIDPVRGPKAVETGLLTGGNFLGIDLEKDLLLNHSDEWILYGNPDAAGNSIQGITLVNKVKDEKNATMTFETLEDFTNALIAQYGRAAAKQFTTVKKGDLTLHTMDLPKITPTWAVAGGKFIFAISSAAAESAATFDGKETLADNADFQALVKKLGVDKYSSFSFADGQRTLPEAYWVWTQIVLRINTDAKEGDPKISLPPLEKLKPFVSPRSTSGGATPTACT